MSDIWDYLKSLFKAEQESSASNPFIHELIERTAEEKAAYEAWKFSLAGRRLINWLADQYAIWQVLPGDIEETIDFLDTPSSKGFVIHFHKTEYNRQEATHFFDYLKERVLSQHYKPQISDTRTWSQDTWVETVERHYLKPKPSRTANSKFDQQFGNITIELSLRNDKVFNLKFRATSYNDHLYQQASDFKELMQAVLE